MAWDDEEEWPEPERDPEKLARARRQISTGVNSTRRRVLRWTYAGLAVLLIIVVLLAVAR